ncbi:MAG: Histidine--tRNA ligase [Chlamydiae bacterium]|nr:Histidine--tRNA ligase [Chlamydiota bacterium]
MDIKAPPGVFDILPKDPKEAWRCSHLWNYVESIIRETAEQFGYQEIRTPMMEKTELFQRSVGEATDIVSKEMYTFEDKGGRLLSLRPEGTAPVIRALLEHHLTHESPIQKFYYIGPMFRYERAQAGRYRQHHQFGAEAIGAGSPEQDVEVIDLLYTVYTRLGLRNLRVLINSIGDMECRRKYREALQSYLKKYFDQLSEDSQRRFEVNPLRILDSKNPKDKEILAGAPSILDFLNEECRKHFEEVQNLLKVLKIPYEVSDKIVRGLDYYNRTVFEVTAEELGAQNSIGGGGRYDDLIHQLGGPELPALGFGAGLERIIQVMLKQNVFTPEPYRPTLFLIPLGEKARTKCFELLHELRTAGIHVQMDFSRRKLGKVMSYANQIHSKFVAVVGDNELESKQVELKDMTTGETLVAPLFHLSRILRIEVEGEDFIRIWKEMNAPFEQPIEAEFFLKKLKQSIESTQHLTKELQVAMKKMEELL